MIWYKYINVIKIGQSSYSNVLNRIVSQAPDYAALLVETPDRTTASQIEDFVDRGWRRIVQCVKDKNKAENIRRSLKPSVTLVDYGFAKGPNFNDFIDVANEVREQILENFKVSPVSNIFEMKYHTVKGELNLSNTKIDIIMDPNKVPNFFEVVGAWGEILLVKENSNNRYSLLSIKTLRNFTIYMR